MVHPNQMCKGLSWFNKLLEIDETKRLSELCAATSDLGNQTGLSQDFMTVLISSKKIR